MFEIEGRGKLMTPADRKELRQREAKPVWDQMAAWLVEAEQRTSNVILPKSDFAKAMNYVRNHWAELTRYLDDGMLPIDNNETELLMRQVAVGRKNWLFAGSVAGGERNAAFLTITSSAMRNDLDVWLYVNDVLKQLLAGSTDYDALLPWNWRDQHPEAVRQYRVEERTLRDAAKQAKRAYRRATQAKPTQ